MHPFATRRQALSLAKHGVALAEVSRRTGVARSTIRQWKRHPDAWGPSRDCPRCGMGTLDRPAYAALLGYYLGDGCISCDRAWPGIIEDVSALVHRIKRGGRVFHVLPPGTDVVTSHWKHWPCLFPQHGPGRTHERAIALESWQQAVVDEFPGDLLRGLFHSDGSRVANWASRTVGGEQRRHDYPRWMFVNHSDDILGFCTDALDRVGIAWRRPRPNCIAVSRRDDVRRLDGLIGPKS